MVSARTARAWVVAATFVLVLGLLLARGGREDGESAPVIEAPRSADAGVAQGEAETPPVPGQLFPEATDLNETARSSRS